MNILLLSSTSRHFPLDVTADFQKAGHEMQRLDSLEDFLCCPKRYQPYLAIFEIGHKDDYDLAFTTYDWMERIQPTAPSRYLLLIASRHLEMRDKLKKFSSAEIAYLPTPSKGLLFKAELQIRLLKQKQINPEGFVVSSEPQDLREKKVLVLRGPNPQSGHWQEGELGLSGKTRWRWINFEEKKLEAEESRVSWEAESKTVPVYQEPGKWLLDDPASDVKCLQEKKEVFSAQKVRKILLDSIELEKTATPSPIKKEEAETSTQPILGAGIGKSEAETTNPNLRSPNPLNAAQKAGSGIAAQNTEIMVPTKKASENLFDRTLSTPTNSSEERLLIHSASQDLVEPLAHRKEAVMPTQPKIPAQEKAELTEAARSASKATLAEREQQDRLAAQKQANENSPSAISRSSNIQEREGESSLRRELKTENLRSEESLPPQGMAKDWNSPVAKPLEAEFISPEKQNLQAKVEAAGRPESSESKAEEAARSQKKERAAMQSIDPAKVELVERELRTAETNLDKKNSMQAEANAAAEKKQIPLQNKAETGALEEANAIIVKQKKEEPSSVLSGSEEWDPIRYKEREEKAQLESRRRVAGEQEDKFITRIPGTSSSEEDSGFLLTRYQIIMTFQELNDNQSSWHPVDQYRIYLSAKHRYYGVKDVAEIFPLWIYEGELAPEFLESKESWRFYDRAPQPYYSLEALPMPVFEFFSHFTAVKDWVNEKKKGLDRATQEHSRFAKEENPEIKKPQRRKRGFWSFVKNLFWKS